MNIYGLDAGTARRYSSYPFLPSRSSVANIQLGRGTIHQLMIYIRPSMRLPLRISQIRSVGQDASVIFKFSNASDAVRIQAKLTPSLDLADSSSAVLFGDNGEIYGTMKMLNRRIVELSTTLRILFAGVLRCGNQGPTIAPCCYTAYPVQGIQCIKIGDRRYLRDVDLYLGYNMRIQGVSTLYTLNVYAGNLAVLPVISMKVPSTTDTTGYSVIESAHNLVVNNSTSSDVRVLMTSSADISVIDTASITR